MLVTVQCTGIHVHVCVASLSLPEVVVSLSDQDSVQVFLVTLETSGGVTCVHVCTSIIYIHTM